jgi:hypothetical protein
MVGICGGMSVNLSNGNEAILLYENGYYQEKLAQGLEFQDYVVYELYKRGIVMVCFSSKKFQNKVGENTLGAEIKKDGKFRETGNLYIETSEKSHPKNQSYVSSGIHRQDNSWLFVIGDEKTIWIFSIKYLQMLQYRYKKKEIATSRGFVMPLKDADKYCLRKITL